MGDETGKTGGALNRIELAMPERKRKLRKVAANNGIERSLKKHTVGWKKTVRKLWKSINFEAKSIFILYIVIVGNSNDAKTSQELVLLLLVPSRNLTWVPHRGVEVQGPEQCRNTLGFTSWQLIVGWKECQDTCPANPDRSKIQV